MTKPLISAIICDYSFNYRRIPISYYPVYLNIKGKKCIVVGGGGIAERKVKSLLKKGADVTVISPKLTEVLSALAKEGSINYIKEIFQEKYLESATLIIAATDDSKVNEEVYGAARKRNILINTVDCPEYCDFIVPSVVERGDLMISISTSGKSPALAKKIRKELQERYGKEYSEFLKIMGKVREELFSKVKDQEKREEIFNSLVNADIIELLKKGEKVDSLVKSIIEKVNDQKE